MKESCSHDFEFPETLRLLPEARFLTLDFLTPFTHARKSATGFEERARLPLLLLQSRSSPPFPNQNDNRSDRSSSQVLTGKRLRKDCEDVLEWKNDGVVGRTMVAQGVKEKAEVP